MKEGKVYQLYLSAHLSLFVEDLARKQKTTGCQVIRDLVSSHYMDALRERMGDPPAGMYEEDK